MRGYLFGAASAVFWAASGLLFDRLPFARGAAFGQMVFLLFLIDLCSLSAVWAWLGRSRRPGFRGGFWRPVLSGLLGGPVGMSAYLLGIHYLTVYYAAPLSSLFPVLAAALSAWFLKERTGAAARAGFALAVLASAGLAADAGGRGGLNALGLVCIAVCVSGWSLEVVLSARTMRTLSGLQVYCLRLCGSVCGYLLILVFLSARGFSLNPSDFYNARIIGIIVFGALSYACYYQAIYLLKPLKAMALNITYPIWAMVLGFFVYRHPVSPSAIIWAVLLGTGAALSLYGREGEI